MSVDIQTQLAGGTVPCLVCGCENGRTCGHHPACKGRTPLFPDAVRVACAYHWIPGQLSVQNVPPVCVYCQGRDQLHPGWTASRDGWEEQSGQITLWRDDAGDWRGTVGVPVGRDFMYFGSAEQSDHHRTYNAALFAALLGAAERIPGIKLGE